MISDFRLWISDCGFEDSEIGNWKVEIWVPSYALPLRQGIVLNDD